MQPVLPAMTAGTIISMTVAQATVRMRIAANAELRLSLQSTLGVNDAKSHHYLELERGTGELREFLTCLTAINASLNTVFCG